MKQLSCFFAALLLSTAVSAAPLLIPAWQSPAEFQAPESVIYHPGSDTLFVSNINGKPNEANGKGFISQMSIKGEILNLHWLDGLDAPKGLALSGDTLYVSDIDKLVAIDINSQKIIHRYPAEGAKFLNDVAIDKNGYVYVSDMMTNRIYRLKDDAFTIWIDDPKLESPNGLLVEKDQLIVGSWGTMTDGFMTEVPGHLKIIDIASKKLASLGDQTPVGNLDGVEADGEGNYLVTDWINGRLLQILPNGSSTTLIAFEPGSADHTVIPEYNLVIIPMMLKNQVLGFQVN